jgi:hypothetical protein
MQPNGSHKGGRNHEDGTHRCGEDDGVSERFSSCCEQRRTRPLRQARGYGGRGSERIAGRVSSRGWNAHWHGRSHHGAIDGSDDAAQDGDAKRTAEFGARFGKSRCHPSPTITSVAIVNTGARPSDRMT